MVWGAIRSDKVRLLIRCGEIVDSRGYQRVLQQALPQIYSSRYLFQHDGAPSHRSVDSEHKMNLKLLLVVVIFLKLIQEIVYYFVRTSLHGTVYIFSGNSNLLGFLFWKLSHI